ncbi:MAG: metallophosphoesterase [Acidobacteriota bacterium]|nr:metallophosphoesterase [Acidobacteriota bacterium]
MKRHLVRQAVGSGGFCLVLPILAVCLSLSLFSAEIQCAWTGVEKIVAVGDLHGDYGNYARILRGTGLVDADMHWIGGKIHFVQLGDILDRGLRARDILDSLMMLEKEAEQAGGKVHALIGNHEEMNITGIIFDYPDYLTPEQFVSFLPEEYRKKKEAVFAKDEGIRVDDLCTDLSSNLNLRNYWIRTIRKDEDARKEYRRHFNKTYGKWLLNQNAVIKINDTIFVHGGISPEYASLRIKDINRILREELGFLSPVARHPNLERIFKPRLVYNNRGPLWYRDLAMNGEDAMREEVDRILAKLDARYMVIAHSYHGSPVDRVFLSRFNGRIWMIDTGISSAFEGRISALIIDNGKFSVWGADDEETNHADSVPDCQSGMHPRGLEGAGPRVFAESGGF